MSEQLTRPAPGERCGFAVIYRFRVRPGLEPQLIAVEAREHLARANNLSFFHQDRTHFASNLADD